MREWEHSDFNFLPVTDSVMYESIPFARFNGYSWRQRTSHGCAAATDGSAHIAQCETSFWLGGGCGLFLMLHRLQDGANCLIGDLGDRQLTRIRAWPCLF